MRLKRKVVGVGIVILGTAVCNFSLLKSRETEADEGGPRRLRYRSETDHPPWSRDQHNLTLVTREHRSGRREQQQEQQEQQEAKEQQGGQPEGQNGGLTGEKLSLVAQDQTESERRLRPHPQQDVGGDGRAARVHEADDVWLELAAADKPAQRNRCHSPPCAEVRPPARKIGQGRFFSCELYDVG